MPMNFGQFMSIFRSFDLEAPEFNEEEKAKEIDTKSDWNSADDIH